MNYWKTIYQKHQNTTGKVWNEEIKDRYDRKMEQEEEMKSNRKLLNEHMDMAFAHTETVAPMNTPMINEENVMKCVKQMKNKTAPGPDGLKAEFYKALVKTENGLSTLTKCMQRALEEEGKVETWKVSHTKMIPKKAKPTADELRPIALTNVSYKMFMTLIKDEIEDHLRRADAIIETQAGFTKGGRIEDNLFILNYCVEASFKKKTPLFVASIDYNSKAFDSIKRSRMIEALMMYRVHPLVIEVIANIYQGDSTIINLNNNTSEEIPVTSGIRQSCTGSTVLFKIITYIIIQIMQATSLGFRNEQFYIPMLFFADDGLILSKSEQEMKTMLKEISNVSKACGLDINKNKSAIIIYNLKDQITEIEGLSVKESLKYLGLSIGNKRNLFSKQKKDMITKAQKMANMTYGIIGKSCNRLMIGKVYWKSLALPSILYGGNIISLTEQDINKLQVIENGVYRQMLGGPRYAPNCTLRGEVGASMMKTKVIKGHLQYIRNTLQGNNTLLKEIMVTQMEEGYTRWAKTTKTYLNQIKLKLKDMNTVSKGEIKEYMRKWDEEKWKEEMESKTSIKIYRKYKLHIEEDQIYDNTQASTILYQARTNTLQLSDRNRFGKESTACKLCKAEIEDLEHFLLHCQTLNNVRQEINILQQPYIEDRDKIMMDFLFNQEEMEARKEGLYQMWKCRGRKLREIMQKAP